ncbi:hypothetical protein VTK26DRAFT_8042 [Humicola hyalothermophila]
MLPTKARKQNEPPYPKLTNWFNREFPSCRPHRHNHSISDGARRADMVPPQPSETAPPPRRRRHGAGSAVPPPAAAAGVTGQEADDDAEEVDDAVDHGRGDAADAADDGHDGAPDCAQGGSDLLAGRWCELGGSSFSCIHTLGDLVEKIYIWTVHLRKRRRRPFLMVALTW